MTDTGFPSACQGAGVQLLTCLVFLFTLASCQPAPTGLQAPVYPAMLESADMVAGIAPGIAATLRKTLHTSEAAYLNGDTETAAAELVNALQALAELPDSPEADIAALEVVIAMEKDLHRLAALEREPDVDSSGRQWNMTCIGGGNFNCRVQRGRWCVQVFYKGKLVGCHNGRMVPS